MNRGCSERTGREAYVVRSSITAMAWASSWRTVGFQLERGMCRNQNSEDAEQEARADCMFQPIPKAII